MASVIQKRAALAIFASLPKSDGWTLVSADGMALSILFSATMSVRVGLSPLRSPSQASSVHMTQVSAKERWLARQSGGAGPVSSSSVPVTEDGKELMPKDIWVTSDADVDTDAATDQTKAVDTVLAHIEQLLSEKAAARPSDPPEGAAELAQLLTDESLDAVVSPHLPLLMAPGYEDAARAALSKVRTVAQQAPTPTSDTNPNPCRCARWRSRPRCSPSPSTWAACTKRCPASWVRWGQGQG